jgi:hypothetical protein
MATIALQPQRVPIGFWTDASGRQVPVLISKEWFRSLDSIGASALAPAPAPEVTQAELDTVAASGAAALAAAVADLEDEIAAIDVSAAGTPPVFFVDEVPGDRGWPGPPGIQGAQGERGWPAVGEQGEPGEPGMPCLATPYRPITNATASRALDTTYTNLSLSVLLVQATVRCAVSVAGGNAYVQAKMDTATPPTVIASGKVGIEAGLLSEDNSFQVSFLVNPGGTYILTTAATNGTVTLGNWFEMPL